MRSLIYTLCAGLLVVSIPSIAADEAAAMALIRKSKCLTCHSTDKQKDGPSYKEVAGKYRGKPEAEEKLVKHITVPNKVKVDGREEDHQMIKSKDPEEIKNVVRWILSL